MGCLNQNKKWVGLAFSVLGLYVYTYGCPGLQAYCHEIALALTNIGSFLTGAGLLESDRFRQNGSDTKKEEVK